MFYIPLTGNVKIERITNINQYQLKQICSSQTNRTHIYFIHTYIFEPRNYDTHTFFINQIQVFGILHHSYKYQHVQMLQNIILFVVPKSPIQLAKLFESPKWSIKYAECPRWLPKNVWVADNAVQASTSNGFGQNYMQDFVHNFIDVISYPLKYVSRVNNYISTPEFSLAFNESFLVCFCLICSLISLCYIVLSYIVLQNNKTSLYAGFVITSFVACTLYLTY